MNSKTLADCPFCKIIGKKTERILQETQNTFTVLSDPRLVPGHLLVIPKRHVEKFSELTKVELAELFAETIKLQEKILEKLATGCDLSQHFRPFIKPSQLKVNHLHLHLRPRKFKDELYERVQKHETKLFTSLSKTEFEKYKKLFRK